MRLEVVYSDRSLTDIEEVLAFIATDNPPAARRWLGEIQRRVDLIGEYPEIGVERHDVAPGLRIHPYRRSVIAYIIEKERVRIIRVLHGGRDYSTLIDS